MATGHAGEARSCFTCVSSSDSHRQYRSTHPRSSRSLDPFAAGQRTITPLPTCAVLALDLQSIKDIADFFPDRSPRRPKSSPSISRKASRPLANPSPLSSPFPPPSSLLLLKLPASSSSPPTASTTASITTRSSLWSAPTSTASEGLRPGRLFCRASPLPAKIPSLRIRMRRGRSPRGARATPLHSRTATWRPIS